MGEWKKFGRAMAILPLVKWLLKSLGLI